MFPTFPLAVFLCPYRHKGSKGHMLRLQTCSQNNIFWGFYAKLSHTVGEVDIGNSMTLSLIDSIYKKKKNVRKCPSKSQKRLEKVSPEEKRQAQHHLLLRDTTYASTFLPATKATSFSLRQK